MSTTADARGNRRPHTGKGWHTAGRERTAKYDIAESETTRRMIDSGYARFAKSRGWGRFSFGGKISNRRRDEDI